MVISEDSFQKFIEKVATQQFYKDQTRNTGHQRDKL